MYFVNLKVKTLGSIKANCDNWNRLIKTEKKLKISFSMLGWPFWGHPRTWRKSRKSWRGTKLQTGFNNFQREFRRKKYIIISRWQVSLCLVALSLQRRVSPACWRRFQGELLRSRLRLSGELKIYNIFNLNMADGWFSNHWNNFQVQHAIGASGLYQWDATRPTPPREVK